MKKILLSIFAILVCFSLTGCANKTENDKSNNDNSNKTNTNKTEEKVTLDNLEEKVKSLGIIFEKTETAYAMVGAKAGYKLSTDEGRVEVYQFDKSGDAYKTAEKKQQLVIESMNYTFEAKVQNGYAYIIDKEFPQYDKVVSLLEKLK